MALASTKPPPGDFQRTSSGAAAKISSVRDLTTGDLDVVFQPIVDLHTGFTFAYEALTRCKWPEFKNPLVLFQQAEAERACGPLGARSARWRSLAAQTHRCSSICTRTS